MKINYHTQVIPLVDASVIQNTADHLLQNEQTKNLAAVVDDVYQMMKTKGSNDSFTVEDMMHDLQVNEKEYAELLPVLATLGLVKLS